MSSLNQVSIIGNLGQDPEVKSFSNGGKIANLRIAASESWKDRTTGERKEKTEWISVVLQSDGLVSVAERFLKKGSKVFIQGKLTNRKWTDQSGNDRYSTEVSVGGFDGKLVMLDSANGNQRNSDTAWTGQAPQAPSGDGWRTQDLDDEVPNFDDSEVPF